MHVPARFDVGKRSADDLPVAAHRRTFREHAYGQLMTGRNRVAHVYAGADGLAGHELAQGDQHVVIGVQVEGGSSGHREPHTSFGKPPRCHQG